MFLWNFCHLFLVLLYERNTSINDSFRFFRFFFQESFPERGFTSQWLGFVFQFGGLHFQVGGASWGVSVLMWRIFQKNHKIEEVLPHISPHSAMKNPETYPLQVRILITSIFLNLFIFCISNFLKKDLQPRFSLVWTMGEGIMFLSGKLWKISPPPRPDSLSLTQKTRGRKGDSLFKRKVQQKNCWENSN